MGTMIS